MPARALREWQINLAAFRPKHAVTFDVPDYTNNFAPLMYEITFNVVLGINLLSNRVLAWPRLPRQVFVYYCHYLPILIVVLIKVTAADQRRGNRLKISGRYATHICHHAVGLLHRSTLGLKPVVPIRIFVKR